MLIKGGLMIPMGHKMLMKKIKSKKEKGIFLKNKKEKGIFLKNKKEKAGFLINKKGMEVSVLFLVVLTLALCGFALVYLSIRESKIRNELYDVAYMDEIYLRESKINFYVSSILEDSVESFKLEEGEQKFIQNFKTELNNYKKGNDFILYELNQIEEQVTEENIEIDFEKVKLNLKMNIQNDFIRGDKEVLYVSYNYEKSFEEELKHL